MSVKKLCKVLALAACIALLSGCWDSRDINDRNILTAVIVDKTDYGYSFYVEIPPIEQTNTSQNGVGSQYKSVVVKADGRTLSETRENLDHKMDRPIFLGAVQCVVLTDKMATSGIEEYLQRLRQISDYRKTVDVIITTEDPMKLLQTNSEHSSSPGISIYETIESLINQGQLFKVPLMEILERLSSSYKHYSLPTFALVDGDLAFTGLTLFSGGYKTGVIPASKTQAIVFMQNRNAKTLYTVPYTDGYAIVQVTLPGKKINPHYENGQISFDLDLRFNGIVLYTEKNKELSDEDYVIISASLKAMLEQELTQTLAQSQTVYKFDCFSLFEDFQNAYPEEYKRMDWAGEYNKAKMALRVQTDVQPTDYTDFKD